MSIAFGCDDKDRLIAFVYGEDTADEREALEAHLLECRACASEVRGLQAVRTDLARWTPPEIDLGFRIVQDAPPARRAWRPAPAWGLALAAALLLAVSAAVANVRVRFEDGAMTVRAGWSSAPAGVAAPAVAAPVAAAPAPVQAGVSERDLRAALDALEARLRSDLSAPGAPVTRAAAPSVDRGALLQEIRELVEASERRQQRELALRLAQVVRDVETQRRADLVRIEQGFGEIEGLTGQEAARQRQMMNYLMRVSQQR